MRRLFDAELMVIVHELLLGVVVVKPIILPRTVFKVLYVSLLVVF